jgi:hypothetical protein
LSERKGTWCVARTTTSAAWADCKGHAQQPTAALASGTTRTISTVIGGRGKEEMRVRGVDVGQKGGIGSGG